MMTHNDILSEIVHLASAALCADLTEVKKQAIGDIAAACASVVACDFGAAKDGKGDGASRSGRLRAATPLLRNLPSERSAFCGAFPRPTEGEATDGAAKDDAAKDGELTGLDKFHTVAPGVKLVRFAGPDEVRLLARRKGNAANPNTVFEIRVSRHIPEAMVSRDGRQLFTVQGFGTNRCVVEDMAVASLHRYLKICAKRNARKYKRAKRVKAERAAARASQRSK